MRKMSKKLEARIAALDEDRQKALHFVRVAANEAYAADVDEDLVAAVVHDEYWEASVDDA